MSPRGKKLKELLKDVEKSNQWRFRTILVFFIVIVFIPLVAEINIPLIVPIILALWVAESYIAFAVIGKQRTISRVNNLSFGQFVFDLSMLTIVVYYLGASEWIAALFYIFTLIYGGFFVSRIRKILLTLLAFSLFSGVMILEYWGILPYQGLFPPSGQYQDPYYVLTTLIAVGGLFSFVTLTVSIFSRSIKRKTQDLVEAYQKLEEIKSTLQIRVKARTKAIEEERASLEKRVKQRTQDLKESQKALLNILEDVEESRAQATQERDRTLAIVNNFADGLIVLDPQGSISLVNPEAERMFDIKEEEIQGKKIFNLDIKPLLPAIKLISSDHLIKQTERKEFNPTEDKTLEVTTAPLKNIGWLAIFHDITREKMVQKLKTEFVSISAHQLRTPLSAIKWTLKMLLEEDLGEITSDQREMIKKTYKSNERMISLINDLLNVTRIEEGRYVYKPELVHLEDLVKKVKKEYQGEIKRKDLKFNFNHPSKKLPKVKVDAEKIKLAISNFVDNAVRYTPRGGEVTINLERKEEEIEFSITDTGIGIPQDQQKRVFSKFFRGANAVRMETEGTGLGLFITKNIIEAHGGEVWFKSEKGEGSTFYFTLPIG